MLSIFYDFTTVYFHINFRSGISPEMCLSLIFPSSSWFLVICLESCAKCQSPLLEIREDLSAKHVLVGLLRFHGHGFIKEHLSKCLISHLWLVLILLSTYLILVINCFLFCFALFFNLDCRQAEGEENSNVFSLLACWQRLVETLRVAFKHPHVLLLFICKSFLHTVDVWGGLLLSAFAFEILQCYLFVWLKSLQFLM